MKSIHIPVCAVLAAASAGVQAQAYPTKPIRAILALGGGGETLARLVGQKMGEALGQPIVIDPQPAVAGSIAAATVAKAPPDGYTILNAATNSQVYRVFLSKNTPYDPVRDFTPIGSMAEAVLVVATSTESKIQNAKDLIAFSHSNPAKLFFGTSGVGTSHHLSGELLQGVANIKMTHVPFKDPNLVATELIANRIPVGFGIFGTMIQHHNAGKLRIIAINNSKRFARTPDIPTLGEQVPGYEPPPGWDSWFGPAKLPQQIVQRLNTELNRAVNAPDLKDKIDALGFIPITGTPEDLAATVQRSIERTAKIVKAAGIQPE